jgi:signal transduction histidine kinase
LRAERLSAIGQLSSGLSADLRQSLGVIRNSIYFLNISLGESLDDKVRRHLTLLLREVNSINRIAANLEALTSKRVPERQPTDVQLLVATALGRIAVPQNVSVEPLVPDGSRLYCDPDQMACALANLVTNAVQALPDGGRVRIGCRGSDDELVMTVTDGGIGMTDEVLVQAFEPLFTTSPHRTGLGLTVVRALTGANGGTVMLESRPGHGTTATLRFPRFD